MKQKTVIYQVMPRWFGNRTEHPVANGTLKQNGCGKFADFDSRVLNAIRALGATHVWYTGVIAQATKTDFSSYGIPRCNPHVVKGEAGSPYAIRDYYDVSAELAVNPAQRMDEFNDLVDRTHHAGMRVIIDFVPNHVARNYLSITAPDGITSFGLNDDKTTFFHPNNNFYYIIGEEFAPQDVDLGSGDERYHEYPAKATGNDCYHAHPNRNDWYETVKLNYGVNPQDGSHHFGPPVPDTWNKMLDILLYWAAKGVDGFRCDMAHMVPVEFWQWVIAEVKRQYPDIIFVAEIYDVNLYHAYLHIGGFDYLYDKVSLYDALHNVLRHNADTTAITHAWQSVDPWRGQMLSFLENHDELRLASPQCCGDAFKPLPAMAVAAMISTGPVMIYAGQELGEPALDAEGYSGLDGRTTIFDYWTVPTIHRWLARKRLNAPHRLRDCYRRLLNLCNRCEAITDGAMHDLMYANNHLTRQYAFLRGVNGGQTLLIVANFDDRNVDIGLRMPAHAFEHLGMPCGSRMCTELLHGGKATWDISADAVLPLQLPPHSAVVWQLTPPR